MGPRRTVREGYDEIADVYAERRSLTGRGRRLAAELGRDLPPGSLVLDAGCGSGGPATRALAPDHELVGLDASRGSLDRLGETEPGVRPVQGDLTALPFADGSFDGLVSFHAVIHVPRERHADVFAEFERVLRRGGEALLVVGSSAWEGRNPDWLDTGVEMFWSFYGRETNLRLLREAGFSVGEETLVNDELGGEFLFVRVQAPR